MTTETVQEYVVGPRRAAGLVEAAGPADVLRRSLVAGSYREILLVRALSFSARSTCDGGTFAGEAHVAYVPDGVLVGEGAIGGALRVLAGQVSFQEQLTVRLRDVLQEVLRPRGVAVVVSARHGGAPDGSARRLVLTTRAVSGVFEDYATRSEFFRMIRR